ncbi:hypothetical protein Hanom_Chr10g00884711 [Helianthus anomalus]
MLTKLLYKTFSKIILQKSKLLYYSNLIITLHFPKLHYRCSKLLYKCSKLLYKTLFYFFPSYLEVAHNYQNDTATFCFFPQCVRFVR